MPPKSSYTCVTENIAALLNAKSKTRKMKKKFLLLTALLFSCAFALRAQQVVICNDVDEHDGKCKPMEAKTQWSLKNGQLSVFALIIFDTPPTYKALQIKLFRNGDMTKPSYSDVLTTYEAGNKCISTSVVFNKKGGYHVQITDDDDKVICETEVFVS